MRIVPFIAVLAGGLAVAASQQRPDLTSTWVATKETPAGLGMAPSAVFGDRFALAVSADAVELTRPVRGNANSLVTTYPFDGSDVAVTQTGQPCFGDAIQTNTATRRDAGFDFAITSNTPPGGSTTPLAIVYRFRPAGDTLVVESTMRDQSGPIQVGTVYRRSTDVLPPPLSGPNVQVAPATIGVLSWLAGEWVALVNGVTVEERWMVPAGGAMLGNSRGTRGTPPAMVEFEFLCIAQRAGGLVYTAMPNGGGMTDFLLTKVSADSVTFENPDHDFPQSITYTKRADDGYDATIAGAPGQRALTYSFRKK